MEVTGEPDRIHPSFHLFGPLIVTRDDPTVQSGQTGGMEAVRLRTGAFSELIEEDDAFLAGVVHLSF